MIRDLSTGCLKKCLDFGVIVDFINFHAHFSSVRTMSPLFDLHHDVADEEIDAQNHVHNLRYLQWTLWAARDHTAAVGWDAKAALEQGVGWVVRAHEVTYRAAALANDRLIIRTWVSEVSRFASRRKYIICRPADRSVLARIETRWVFVDLNIHKAIEIPEEATQRIEVLTKAPPMPWEES